MTISKKTLWILMDSLRVLYEHEDWKRRRPAFLACVAAASIGCAAPHANSPEVPAQVQAAQQPVADAVRVIVAGNLHVARNSYEDEYSHSMDSKVDAAMSYEGSTTSLVVGSHDMSGVLLELRFTPNGVSDPSVVALGTWRRDFGPRGAPRMGHLDDVSGIVLVNTSYVDRADPLICRFFIIGKRNGTFVTVSGAVSVNAPKLR